MICILNKELKTPTISANHIAAISIRPEIEYCYGSAIKMGGALDEFNTIQYEVSPLKLGYWN